MTDAYGYTIGDDGRGLMVSRSKDGEAWSFGWAPCEKPWWIFKGEVGHEYGYTASGAKYRHVQVNGQTNGQWNRTKATFFLGDLEQDWENINGTWSVAETRLTISGPGGAIGVCTIAGDHVQGQPTREWYHKDHLGSVAFVTDEAGNVSRYSYDAWGHRRDPQTRERMSIDYTPLAGYTGHDMLDNLGIVHMGGRLYDPLLGRTLSPDPLVRNPSFSESYNRYSYVENRPLSATDPTGYAVNMSIDWLASPDLGIGKDYSGMFAPGPGSWNPVTITFNPGNSVNHNSSPATATRNPVVKESRAVTVPAQNVGTQPSTVSVYHNNSGGLTIWAGGVPLADVPGREVVSSTVREQLEIHAYANEGIYALPGERADTALIVGLTTSVPVGVHFWRGLSPVVKAGGLTALDLGGFMADPADPLNWVGLGLWDEGYDFYRLSTKCFPEGTLVATPEGLTPIEDLKEGDTVLAYDFENKQVVERKITELERHETDTWIEVEFNDGTKVVSTRGHLFWVESEEAWVQAINMLPGMSVKTQSGEILELRQTRLVYSHQNEKTYNFIVEGLHNYFVGDRRILVHNGVDEAFLSSTTYTWSTDYSTWTDEFGKTVWPLNGGFEGASFRYTLLEGAFVDRYGLPQGFYLSPAATPYEMRALAPGSYLRDYTVYHVAKPFDVTAGSIAPWFGEPGKGLQFMTDERILDLEKSGHLIKLYK